MAALALLLSLALSSNRVARAVEFADWCPPIRLPEVDSDDGFGPRVNTPYSDGGPAISKDGRSLYFHSNRPGGTGGTANFDLYVSQRASEDEPWGAPQNLGPTINTAGVETVPALSRDGHWLFFNSIRAGGRGGFDIWASYREHVHDDLAWEPSVNLGPGVNSEFSDGGASYFENDEFGLPLLFFASNRPGGQGGFDIYVSALQTDGSFGPAARVEELSSPFNDQRPAIRFDGLELFLTRGAVSPAVVNENDIFVSTRRAVSDPWSPPLPLSSTVNSDQDDDIRAYIASDRQTLFFESGKNEPFGNMDIYVTTRPRKGGNCPQNPP